MTTTNGSAGNLARTVVRTRTPAATAAPASPTPAAATNAALAIPGATPTTNAAPVASQAALARTLGQTTAIDPLTKLPRPTSAENAFDTLPASSSGVGQVRRYADDNVNAWNMVLDLIRGADTSMHFSFFTIEKDPYGWAFLGGALYNQMRGVQVTGMTDWSSNARGRGFSTTMMGYEYLQELVNNGAHMALFNTPGARTTNLVAHGPSYGLVGCNHDKMLVVDANTPRAQGETGGRNIAAPYHQDAADNAASWRDDTLHIRGAEATAGFVTSIEREYAGRACKRIKPDIVNLNNRARELLASYALMEEWVNAAPLSDADKTALRTDPARQQAAADQLMAAMDKRLSSMIAALPASSQKNVPTSLSADETGRVRKLAAELVKDANLCGSRAAYDQLGGFTTADVKIVDQIGAASAAPGQRFNEIAPALKHLFDGAQKSILIQNPYVVLTEPMVKTLEEASKRGVKITIVTNSPESTDSAVTQGFFLNDWAALLARIPTLDIHVATGQRKFHAKCFVVDDVISADMSYNADLLSGRVNGEIGALTKSTANAIHLRDAIAADLKNPANGFSQWTIQKDAQGRAVLDAKGQPIVTHGPADDVSPQLLRRYGPMQTLCRVLADNNDDLRHPTLSDALKPQG